MSAFPSAAAAERHDESPNLIGHRRDRVRCNSEMVAAQSGGVVRPHMHAVQKKHPAQNERHD